MKPTGRRLGNNVPVHDLEYLWSSMLCLMAKSAMKNPYDAHAQPSVGGFKLAGPAGRCVSRHMQAGQANLPCARSLFLLREALTGKPAWGTKSHLCLRSHSHDRKKLKAIFWGLVFVGDFWWILRNINALHLAPAAFVILLPLGNCSRHGWDLWSTPTSICPKWFGGDMPSSYHLSKT